MPASNGDEAGFHELTSKLSTDELIRKLKANFKLLQDLDCSRDSLETLSPLAASLIQPFLRHHASKDVRLLAACCVAEIFNVFFPDPPYDEEQLKNVFSLFVSQLQGLEDPSSPSFKWSFQLLESLASTKAFNLCFSIDAPDIIADLFKMVFSIVNEVQSTKVKMYMLDMMASLLQEGESISQAVLDTILINIVDPVKSENVPAYTLAEEFIRKTSSFLEPYIQLFFSNALVVGKSSESEVADHLYDLIVELHNIDSQVLLNVMPQLEFKLKSSDTEERHEVTRLLARMFSPRDSRLAVENKPLWLCFLKRYSDISATIRLECVKFSKYFLVYHPNLAEDVAVQLHDRFHDRDDKVRLEVVKAVCEAAADNMKAVPKMLLDDLQERMRDKVWAIRKEAISNIARLYRQVVSSSFSAGVPMNKSDARSVSWMPNKILHLYYQTSNEDRLTVERCVLSCIVPVVMPDEERVQRLIYIYGSLDEHATRAFDVMLQTRHELRSHLLEIITFHLDTELQGERKKKMILTKVIQLARKLPEPVKAQSHLQDLVGMLDDRAVREALQRSLDSSISCHDIMKAKSEVVMKIGPRHVAMDTVKALLDRGCPMLTDTKSVEVLVEQVCGELSEPSLSQSAEEEKEEFEKAKKAVRLMKVISGLNPKCFRSSELFQRLLSLLRHEDAEIACGSLQTLVLVGKNIDQSEAGCLQPILTQLAQKGPPALAKHTVKCINSVFKEPKAILRRLFTSLTSHLDYDHPSLHTSLISLAHIATSCPDLFETKHKLIVRDFVVKQLLVVDRTQGGYEEGVPEWCEDEDVSYEARTKVLGLKLLVSWLIGLQSDHKKAFQPVQRLLYTLLCHDGDLQGDDNVSAPDRTRLRLAAACGMLKLARTSHYHELITLEQFQKLALTLQDSCEEVRDRFALKLNKGLRNLKLPLSYLSIFALAGTEPRREARLQVRRLVMLNIEKRRELLKQHSKAKEHLPAILPEYAVSHTIHLLSHHPNFSRTNPQALDNFRDCLWFFLEPLVHKSDNYDFLRKLVETIKQTEDAQEPTNTEANKNLYAVCDLAFGVLSKKLTHIKIGDFPGDVLLPVKLFKTRGKNTQGNALRYLPPDYDCTPSKHLRTEVLSVSVASGETTVEEVETTTPGKKPKAPRATQQAKTPTKRTSKAPTPKKGPSKGTPKAKTPSSTRKRRAGRAAKEPEKEEVQLDTTEDHIEEEEEEEPKKKQKTTPTVRRNVKRKILQDQKAESAEDGEQNAKSQDHVEEEEEEEPKKKQKTTPTVRRNVKRKILQDQKAEPAEDGEQNAKSQVDSVEEPPVPKKTKVADTSTAVATDQSISIKRKRRQRK